MKSVSQRIVERQAELARTENLARERISKLAEIAHLYSDSFATDDALRNVEISVQANIISLLKRASRKRMIVEVSDADQFKVSYVPAPEWGGLHVAMINENDMLDAVIDLSLED